MVGVEYQLLNPLTLSARGHFTNFVNRPAGVTNPTLTRLEDQALVPMFGEHSVELAPPQLARQTLVRNCSLGSEKP